MRKAEDKERRRQEKEARKEERSKKRKEKDRRRSEKVVPPIALRLWPSLTSADRTTAVQTIDIHHGVGVSLRTADATVLSRLTVGLTARMTKSIIDITTVRSHPGLSLATPRVDDLPHRMRVTSGTSVKTGSAENLVIEVPETATEIGDRGRLHLSST